MRVPEITIVLASPGPVEPGGNPFIRLLYSSLDSDIRVEDFSWIRAIFGPRYDVLHLHWPEYVIRTSSPWQRFVKLVLMSILPLVTKARGVRTIWTVHNLSPHEHASRVEDKVLAAWAKSVSTRIYLTGIGAYDDARAVVIKHGDYKPIVEHALHKSAKTPKNDYGVVVFGVLRPMKGLEDVFMYVVPKLSPRYTVRIVGEPISESYSTELNDLLRQHPQVEGRLEVLSDDSLVHEILAASVVLLPYRKLYNSGALLLALSCGRPAVAPATPTTLELQLEVGPEWLQLFASEDPESIAPAILKVSSMKRRDKPTFSGRSWETIGEQYSAVYRGDSI